MVGAISKCNLIRDLQISRELVCDLLEVCFAADIIFFMNMIVNATTNQGIRIPIVYALTYPI